MESPNPNIISLTTVEQTSVSGTVVLETDSLEIEKGIILRIGSCCHLPSLECVLHAHSLKPCRVGWIHRERHYGNNCFGRLSCFCCVLPVIPEPMETENVDDRSPGRWVTSCQKCLNYLYLDEKEYESGESEEVIT